MHTLSLSNEVRTHAREICSNLVLNSGLKFAGVRLRAQYATGQVSSSETGVQDVVILAGADVAELTATDALTELPLTGPDQQALGVLFAPHTCDSAKLSALQACASAVQALLRGYALGGAAAPQAGNVSIAGAHIFELSAEAFCIVGMDGTFKRLNAAFTQMLGRSEESLLQQPYLDLVHEDDHPATLAILVDLERQGRVKGFRNRYVCRSGDYCWLEWSAVYAPEENLIYASARDVTDLVRAEGSIRETNQLLQTVNKALLDYLGPDSTNAPFEIMLAEVLRMTGSEYGFIGEVLYDPDGSPYLKSRALSNIAWNDESRRIYEQARQNGMEFRNLQTLFGRVLTTGKPVFSNAPKSDPRAGGIPHGHPAMHAFLGAPIYSGSHFVGMLGIANRPGGYDEGFLAKLELFLSTCSTLIIAYRADRARVETEALLRQEEQRRRAIVDTALDSIIVLSPCGRIDSANPATSELFKQTLAQLQGSSFLDLLDTPSRQSVQDYLDALALEPQTRYRQELSTRTADGRELTLDVALSATLLGAGMLVVGVLRDISLLKQTERGLSAAMQAAERASQAKSDFLAHMSHELRTPINGVIGMLELSQQSASAEEQQEFLATAASCADQMLLLVNDLLDFAKIEAGQLLLEESILDLRSMLQELTREPRLRAMRKGLTLSVEVADNVPDALIGDSTRLSQVLLNLLSNAIKFTDHGQIALRVRCLPAGSHSARVHFAVHDTGIGIEPEQQAHIFDAFVQADTSITRRFGGTGLGLSISAQLVKLMQGTLQVQSEPGKGSCFEFAVELRLAAQTVCRADSGRRAQSEQDRAAANSDTSTESAPTPLRVLLAEDNLVNQKLISTVLERRGHRVELAEDGERAVALATSSSFDVILMDLQMPLLDGIEATRQIRQRTATDSAQPRIIALTAHALQSDAARCRDAGMNGFLAKPMKIRDLVDVVENATDA